MDTDAVLATISADGQRLLEVARDLDATVPTCPDWSVGDLMAHIGRVHHNVAEHVARRATERLPADAVPSPPSGPAVRGYAEEGLGALLAALSSADPTEPIWTWSDRQDVGFYVRRMLHETAVHRYDAECASDDSHAGGDVSRVDDDQGADGIDELYGAVLGFSLRGSPRPLPAGSLHLHRTDGGVGEWTLRVEADQVTVGHGHEQGDAAVRGPGGDLFLAMWGRVPLDRLDVFGDPAVGRAWIELAP